VRKVTATATVTVTMRRKILWTGMSTCLQVWTSAWAVCTFARSYLHSVDMMEFAHVCMVYVRAYMYVCVMCLCMCMCVHACGCV